MIKKRIKRGTLSYNQAMEQTKQLPNVPTKADKTHPVQSKFFSKIDEKEFRVYQRNKRVCEAKRAIAKTQASVTAGEDLQTVCQRAVRLRQAAVRLPLSKLHAARLYVQGSGVGLDCAICGDGETLTKVKVYEAKLAARCRADEITVPVTPSFIDACRFQEIKKELIKIKRAVGKTKLKVRVEKTNSPTALSRLARITSESGARFFSVPYFDGCERLRMHLTGGCGLEVTNVQEVDDFKKLVQAGVSRIDTKRGLETYTQLLKEIGEMENEVPMYEMNDKKIQPCADLKRLPVPKNPSEETNYFCRLENGELKFL